MATEGAKDSMQDEEERKEREEEEAPGRKFEMVLGDRSWISGPARRIQKDCRQPADPMAEQMQSFYVVDTPSNNLINAIRCLVAWDTLYTCGRTHHHGMGAGGFTTCASTSVWKFFDFYWRPIAPIRRKREGGVLLAGNKNSDWIATSVALPMDSLLCIVYWSRHRVLMRR